jgi:hypothetical protein
MTSSAASSVDGLGDADMPARYAFTREGHHHKNALRLRRTAKKNGGSCEPPFLFDFFTYGITTGGVPVPWKVTVPR